MSCSECISKVGEVWAVVHDVKGILNIHIALTKWRRKKIETAPVII